MSILGPFNFLRQAMDNGLSWHRTGKRLPIWVHGLAIFGALLGIWMAWLDSTIGEFDWLKAMFEVAVMPVLAYIGFFAYSRKLL